MLSEEQTEMFQRLLNTQRDEILNGNDKAVHELGNEHDTFADPSDRAAWESDSTRELRILDRERKLLEKIEDALGRLDDGSFGECDECGEMISVGRLRARPVTTLCIECKAQQESQEGKPNFKG